MDFFNEMPEEAKQAIQAAHDRHEMVAEDYKHRVFNLFNDLTEEEVVTLRWMIQNIAMDSSGQLASYYHGQLTIIGTIKFGLCGACGANHDKEAAEALATPPEQPAEKEPEAPVEGPKYVNMYNDLTHEDLKNMHDYHLDDLRDEDDNGRLIGFICTGIIGGPPKGCGMTYPSIQDRMRKPPEHCSGCFTKAAHG